MTMLSVIGAAGLLGAGGYGTYAFILATVGLSAGVGQLGIAPIVSREIARTEKPDAGAFATVVIGTTATTSAVIAAVSIVVIKLFDVGSVASTVDVWLAVGIVAWAMASGVSTIAQAILVGRQWFSSAALVLALRSISISAATVAGALSGDFRQTTIPVLLTECGVAIGTLLYLRYRGLLRLDARSFDARAKLAHVMRIGSSSGFASLMVQVSFWGGSAWLMSQPGGAAANGAFAVALRIALGASVIPAALTTVLVPLLSSGRPDISRRDSTVMPSAVAALCALAVSLVMPYLFDTWLHDYGDFAAVFFVMLAGIVPVVMNETIGAVALAGGHIRAWVVSDVVLATVAALVYWPTVPAAGALGLAVAHVAGYTVSIGVLSWAVLRLRRSTEINTSSVRA
ncbi:hypothetical protein ACI78T_06655 [Blastococcus sp. SYSU D00922]